MTIERTVDIETLFQAVTDDRPVDVVVTTHGLVRKFGKQRAVDGIDLVVPSGSVFGFLGPNGSGKTTTIRLILGLLAANSGTVELFGEPMPQAAGRALPRVGAVVEGPAFFPFLSGDANLGRLQAIDGADNPRTAARRRGEALERVGLTAAAGKPYRHYSMGMKQRLAIASVLLRPRDLLILDEPTNGLDPQGTREIRALIRQLNSDDTTVIVSSHLLSEIEQVCTHVGIMSRGRLIAQQSLDALRAARAPRLRVETTPRTVETARRAITGLGLAVEDAGAAAIEVAIGEVPVYIVTRILVESGTDVLGLGLVRPGLEEIFVELTGAGFDVAG